MLRAEGTIRTVTATCMGKEYGFVHSKDLSVKLLRDELARIISCEPKHLMLVANGSSLDIDDDMITSYCDASRIQFEVVGDVDFHDSDFDMTDIS